MAGERDRDEGGRARQARPRDALGRPLEYGATGVEPVDETPLPPQETIELALRYVDAGRCFAAHEVFETRWKSCPADERDLWQGLAQVCVAMTHVDRGNTVGAQRLMQRAVGHLQLHRGRDGATYGDVDERLLARARTQAGAGPDDPDPAR